jgi:carbamoyltransferase
MKPTFVISFSCYYHDSAAVLIRDGEILGAVQEERFSRKKHDDAFPLRSITWLMEKFSLNASQIDACIYYEKPFITFERLIETHLAYAPFGYKNFLASVPLWIKGKLFLERDIRKHLKTLGLEKTPVKYSEHHLSHAASAFYPSPFEEAIVLCVDGVGEWATTSVWRGDKNKLEGISEIHFPHSLGLLYSAVTSYLGFKVNSGEYKVMGLAPYGKPIFKELMLQNLIYLHVDGSYSLNMKYFVYGHSLKMFSREMEKLLGRKARRPETELDDFHMNVAASLQAVLEEALLHVVKSLKVRFQTDNLCLAGGVALNCVANSRLLKDSGFKNIWVQPAAGDAGGALGAALAYWHLALHQSRTIHSPDGQKGSLLGPDFSTNEIEEFLLENKIPFQEYETQKLWDVTSANLEEGKIIGWFQGKMEYGPRALGNRSIIGDARILDLQKTMNLKIKYRESFRPFAPIVLIEDVEHHFEWKGPSPYMLFTALVRKEHLLEVNERESNKFGIERLNVIRSKFPAITHVDNSARLQTVHKDQNPDLHGLLSTFKLRNHTSVLVNTSFNVRGEPIVCTPRDAYLCFRRTEIDVLVLGKFIIIKKNLPEFNDSNWRNEFELD